MNLRSSAPRLKRSTELLAQKATQGKTVGERVIDKLKSKAVVDKDRVKISDMSSVGKDGQVEQVSLEVAFR